MATVQYNFVLVNVETGNINTDNIYFSYTFHFFEWYHILAVNKIKTK